MLERTVNQKENGTALVIQLLLRLAANQNIKRKKISREVNVASDDSDVESVVGNSEDETTEHQSDMRLPAGTPEWGIKLLEIIQNEFRSVNSSISVAEENGKKNTHSIKKIERRLATIEDRNKTLEFEKIQLKEKLLELEYRQRRCNLVFDGVADRPNETDLQCIRKLRFVLRNIAGLNVDEFRIDRCHRLDGSFKPGVNRRVICAFNWYYDVQCILRGRKSLPKGVYVSEDLPEEWVDKRKVLKPIYNAAKRMENLKLKTHLSKDKLRIDSTMHSAGPDSNLNEVNAVVDTVSTCQKNDNKKILFLGSLSPYSNLYQSNFSIDNTTYTRVEQFIQSEKAGMFDDDAAQHKIMQEKNPYKIKKLGTRIRNFSLDAWRKSDKLVAHRAVFAKFSQNMTLKNILLNSGDILIAESSGDPHWGTGIHLHDGKAMDKNQWKNKNGGVMCEILAKVCQELRAKH